MSTKRFSGSLGLDPRLGRRGRVAAALAVVLGSTAGVRAAEACSVLDPASVTPTAIPRTGATDVPTATSFVIVAGAMPAQVALDADGVDVPLTSPTLLGAGREASVGPMKFWQVKSASVLGFLPPSATLKLSSIGPQGVRVTLTTVKTAAGYDKQPGTPANVKSLKLTRVRHPLKDINAGTCVFAEYVGFVEFEADAATFPGTPADSIVTTYQLSPKHGGAATQTFVYAGAKPYTGDEATPAPSGWNPYLDPSLEYCLAIGSFGVGDVARLPVVSNSVCARVDEVSLPGAGDDPDAGAPAGPDAGAPAEPDAGAQPDAGDDGASAAFPDGGRKVIEGGPQSGGCAISGGDRAGRAFGTALFVLLVLSVGRRRSSRRS